MAQDKPPRDSGGAIVDRTAWHDIVPDEFMLNIVDLPAASAHAAQRRARDNRATHERIGFDAGRGLVFVEHFHSARCTEHTTSLFQNAAFTRKFAEGFWRRAKEGFSVEKAAWVTYEIYDTGMSYRDCSGKRSLDDVAK